MVAVSLPHGDYRVIDDHCDRVLNAIKQDISRPTPLAKATCLSVDHVRHALKNLKKQHKIKLVDGEWKIKGG